MPTPLASHSRHSSTMSIDTVSTVLDDASSDTSEPPTVPAYGQMPKTPVTPRPSGARRTRQKFTHEQVADLEALFHVHSHPSREHREGLANKHDLSLRCVTIWFQNKRQIERRTTTHSSQLLLATPPGATTIYSKSLGSVRQLSPLHSPVSSSSTLVSHPRSSPLRSPIPRTASLPQHSFLDAVVLTPRTPPKTRPTLERAHTLPEGLWERMPGSPTKPMRSPEKTRSFVERTRGVRKHRTLEWACAAARLPSLDGDGDTDVDDVDDLPDRGTVAHVSSANISRSSFSSTNNDSDAATLPSSSPTVGSVPGGMPSRANHDEETLIAAHVLCGLGQR